MCQETNNSMCTHGPGLGINERSARSVKRSLSTHLWKRKLAKLKMVMSQKQDPKRKTITLLLDKKFLDIIKKNHENETTWYESIGTWMEAGSPSEWSTCSTCVWVCMKEISQWLNQCVGKKPGSVPIISTNPDMSCIINIYRYMLKIRLYHLAEKLSVNWE